MLSFILKPSPSYNYGAFFNSAAFGTLTCSPLLSQNFHYSPTLSALLNILHALDHILGIKIPLSPHLGK